MDIGIKLAKLAKEKGFFIFRKSFDTCDGSTISISCISNESDQEYDKRLHLIYTKLGVPTFDLEPKDLIIICSQDELQKWLRETHNLSIEVSVGENIWEYTIASIVGFEHIILSSLIFKTYEKALESGLIQALKLLKNA